MSAARAFVLAWPVALLLAVAAGAQIPSPTGSIHGTLLDADARSLPGATVTLTGPGAPQTAKTDERGGFHFLNLPPGIYSVAFELAGFETVRRQVVVTLDRNSILSVSMPVANAVENVAAPGFDGTVDTRKVETGATFSRNELDRIPTTRDPWSLLRQVPGVLIDSVSVGSARTGQVVLFVGKGSHPDQNTYNLDGVSISVNGFSPLFFDFDSLDGLGFSTGGSDPALASPGVTLNLVTKRGTNQPHGSARALYTDGSRWDYGAEAGGPLWKDRLWLWAAGASNAYQSQTFLLPDDESVRYDETQDYWNVKLNAQPSNSNSLTLSYLNFQRWADGRGAQFGNRSEASTWDNSFPGSSYRLEDSEVLSDRLAATIEASYVPTDNLKTPKGGLRTQADKDLNFIWRNSYYEWDVQIIQRQAGVTASGFFNTGELRHELKFGFGYRQAHWDSSSVWPADQLVGYEFSQLADVTRASNKRMLLNFYDTYLGDTIQTGNLTVNLGARFDYQQGKNLASSVPANPAFPDLLPAVAYPGDSTYPITWRTVEPRIGATYALGPERSTLVRASYARFANQMALEVGTVNAFPGLAYLGYGWADANQDGRVEPGEVDVGPPPVRWGNVNPDAPGSQVPIDQISASLQPPLTGEWILGVEQRVAPGVSASLGYTHRSLRNPEFTPLIGTTRASYRYDGNASGTAIGSDGFVLPFSEPYYGLETCPAPCAGSLLQNRPDVQETYDGLELQVVKNLSHGWMARASFAYNNWRQQVGAGGVVNPNNELPGANATGPLVQDANGTYINAIWQFNLSGAIQLPLGILAGINLFGRQGFPIPFWVQVVTHDKEDNQPAIQIGQATDFRTPGVVMMDLQLEKSFAIGSRLVVSPVIACFNALDSRTVLSRDGFVGTYDPEGSPAFQPAVDDDGNPTANGTVLLLSGRIFRAGVRISF